MEAKSQLRDQIPAAVRVAVKRERTEHEPTRYDDIALLHECVNRIEEYIKTTSQNNNPHIGGKKSRKSIKYKKSPIKKSRKRIRKSRKRRTIRRFSHKKIKNK